MAEERTQAQMFEAISKIVDGEAPEEGCLRLLETLDDCHPCRQFLASLSATRRALESAGHAPELPEGESEHLLAECRQALRARCPDLFGEKPAP